jgi:ADP-ribose pyrophosphatase YjhB (NUDIX family)
MLYAHYIPVAGLFGFRYHHAEGEDATLLLWLREGECKVPPYATHHVGVAGALIYGDEILVVKERVGPGAGSWKLPGGYANLGEDLGAAAVREVWEETGVAAEFREVVALRHSHGAQWGRSDVYAVCRLRAPRGAGGPPAVTPDAEVADARWMRVDEFRKQNKFAMLDKVGHHHHVTIITSSPSNLHVVTIITLSSSSQVLDVLLLPPPAAAESCGGLAELTMNSTIPGRSPFKLYCLQR